MRDLGVRCSSRRLRWRFMLWKQYQVCHRAAVPLGTTGTQGRSWPSTSLAICVTPAGGGTIRPARRPPICAGAIGRSAEGQLRRRSWRRGRDSNPRYPCEYAAFRVRCFQPLSHLSAAASPSVGPLTSQEISLDLFVLLASAGGAVLQFWPNVLQTQGQSIFPSDGIGRDPQTARAVIEALRRYAPPGSALQVHNLESGQRFDADPGHGFGVD